MLFLEWGLREKQRPIAEVAERWLYQWSLWFRTR